MRIDQDKAARQAFGTVLRGLRREMGLSQEEFGERAGLHRTYVSMMERGIKAPTIVTLVDLARAVGMETADLMALFDAELAVLTAGGTASTGSGHAMPVGDEEPARRSHR